MQLNIRYQFDAETTNDWDAIEREEAEWFEEDQRAAIRPELSAAWSKLRAAVVEFAYDLAVAFDRASIQQRRSPIVRTLCRIACNVFAYLRLARSHNQERAADCVTAHSHEEPTLAVSAIV